MALETRQQATAIPGAVWGVAAVITFGGFMSGLDASLVNVGLDTIGRDLHASLTSTQWVTSAYLLALASALPACGWLGRRIGGGRLWLWALALFTALSALCAVAPDVGLLIAFRALQGASGGVLVTSGMTILAEVAGPGRMGRILAVTGVPTVLAPALGPTVGALLLANLSWSWLFLINLPIGALGVALGLRFVPRGGRRADATIDLAGLVLVATGLPLLTYGITALGDRGTLLTPAVYLPLLIGAVALAAFGRRSLRRESPLLDVRLLLANRVFAAAACQLLFGGVALFGGQIVMPLYFQLLRGQPIVDTGLLLLPFGLGAAATFPIAGRLTDRYGGGRVASAGLLVTALVTFPMVLLAADTNFLAIEGLQVLRGIGLALSGAPAIAAAFAAVPHHQLADASAQINILSRTGGALGSALLVVVLTRAGQGPAAFQTTFGWLTLAAVIALISALWLVFEQRKEVPA